MLSKSIVANSFTILLACGMLFGANQTHSSADNHLIRGGVILSDADLEAATGASPCPDCAKANTVCGFTCVVTWTDPRCIDHPCDATSGLAWWGHKCSVGFTDQKLCVGSGYDPNCTHSHTIDCGDIEVCLFAQYSCINTWCKCTGLSFCGGIPHVGGCGTYASCS